MLNPRIVAAIRAEPIVSVALGKAFYTYEIRNAWVDWNGTTSITHRPSGFTLTIEEAKDWAERSRVQGSRFRIEEIPIIGIYGTSATLYLSERKSSRPLARYADVICSPKTLATLAFVIDTITVTPTPQLICFVDKENKELTATDGTYWRRESSPGRGFNSLGWTVTREDIDETAIRRIASALDGRTRLFTTE